MSNNKHRRADGSLNESGRRLNRKRRAKSDAKRKAYNLEHGIGPPPPRIRIQPKVNTPEEKAAVVRDFKKRQKQRILDMFGSKCGACGMALTLETMTKDHFPGHHIKKVSPNGSKRRQGCMKCLRGILCQPCNLIVGHYEAWLVTEWPEYAISYVKRHGSKAPN